MKKTVILMVVLIFTSFLCGCNQPIYDESLNYPDLHWGMTVEQVIDALALSADEYQLDSDSNNTILIVHDAVCFGEKTVGVSFNFTSILPDSTAKVLKAISIQYPDGTDMDNIMASLSNTYGPPSNTDYPTKNGNTSEGHIVYWETQNTLEDALTEAEYAALIAINPDSNWHEDALTEPLATVIWTDDAAWVFGSGNTPSDFYNNTNAIFFEGECQALLAQLRTREKDTK